MNGRIYDGLLGRFLSADILVSNPGSLQSFNRYSYVGNNPLSTTDPSGFESNDEKAAREHAAEAARRKAVEAWIAGTGGAPRHDWSASSEKTKAAADNSQTATTTATERTDATAIRPSLSDTLDTTTAPTTEEKKTEPKKVDGPKEPKSNPFAVFFVAQDIADSAAEDTAGKSEAETKIINNNKAVIKDLQTYQHNANFFLKRKGISERVSILYFKDLAQLKKMTIANVGDKTVFAAAIAHGRFDANGRYTHHVTMDHQAVHEDDFKEGFEPIAKAQSPSIVAMKFHCDALAYRHPDELGDELQILADKVPSRN